MLPAKLPGKPMWQRSVAIDVAADKDFAFTLNFAFNPGVGFKARRRTIRHADPDLDLTSAGCE